MVQNKNKVKELSEDPNIRWVLDKFDIDKLNPMQVEAYQAIQTGKDVVLLSPTGTGKTLSFLIPLIETLDEQLEEIQMLILVPTRELAQQIEQVIRNMGSGYKVNSVYGGRAGNKDKQDLKHLPAILIGTPGRIADRFRRDNYSLKHIQTLVLDEYDKSLEIGFESEMSNIVRALPNVKQRVLTSATSEVGIPEFLKLQHPIFINYLNEESSQLSIKTIISPKKDKLDTLGKTLAYIGPEPGIVFCNFKDSIQRVGDYLTQKNIPYETFHGGMEQIERERSLIKFRNGTTQLLLATDLAARGLDIPEIKFIIHYHLPMREKEFTHRNGRTARMNNEGIAYVLHWEGEVLPEFIANRKHESIKESDLTPSDESSNINWKTLHLTGGRRDKISKGDIAGLLIKKGKVHQSQVGVIELQQNASYVGVHEGIVKKLIKNCNNQKLKKTKVRITVL